MHAYTCFKIDKNLSRYLGNLCYSNGDDAKCRLYIKGHEVFGLKISHSFDEILSFTLEDTGFVRFAVAFGDKFELKHLKAIATVIGVWYEFLIFVPGIFSDIDKFHEFTIPDVEYDGWDEEENEVECFR